VKLHELTPPLSMGSEMFKIAGLITERFTTAEVVEISDAVATAVSAYEFAGNGAEIRMKGAVATEPCKMPLAKKSTLVTVLPLTEASTTNFRVAGAAKTDLLTGFVMVMVGCGSAAEGVERV